MSDTQIDRIYLENSNDAKYKKFRDVFTQKYGSSSTGALLNYMAYGSTVVPTKPEQIIPEQSWTEQKSAEMAGMKGEGPNLFQRIGSDIQQRGENLQPAIQEAGGNFLNVPKLALRTAGQLSGGINDVAKEVMTSGLQTAGGLIPQGIKDKFGPAQDGTVQYAGRQQTPSFDLASIGADQWSQLEKAHPEMAQSIRDVANVVGASFVLSGAQKGLQKVGGDMNLSTGVRTKGAIEKGVEAFGKSEPLPTTYPVNPQDIQQSVMPPVTAKEMQNANPQLRNKGGFFRNPSISPTTQQQGMARVAETIEGYNPSAGPIDNAKVVHNAWGNEAEALKKSMSANERLQKVKLTNDELLGAVGKGIDNAGLDPKIGVGKKIMRVWQESIASASNGKPTGGWQSKIDFSKEATRKWGASIYDKGTDIADAVNETHSAVNDLIKAKTAGMGVDYAAQMDRLTSMHGIMENLAAQLKGGELRSTFGNIVRNPWVRTTAAITGGSALIGGGVNLSR